MALGEMLTKLPVDVVQPHAGPSVGVLLALVEEDREWSVIDAACAALALVLVRFPGTVALDNTAARDEHTPICLPSASAIASKMIEILPLNIGHAASVLVALMRVSAAGVGGTVEDYLSSNVRAYTRQNFTGALSGIPPMLSPSSNHSSFALHI
jgi:hypothetical protein